MTAMLGTKGLIILYQPVYRMHMIQDMFRINLVWVNRKDSVDNY